MFSYQPVPPDAVRVWWGYRKEGLDHNKFFKRLGSVFIPATVQIQSQLGLTAYLPTVLPQIKPGMIPDEIALVFYRSQQLYKGARNSVGGRAYGDLHSTAFNFRDPHRSKSNFPIRYTHQIERDTPYYLFENATDWSVFTSKVLVGSKPESCSTGQFINSVEEVINDFLSNPLAEIDNGYFVLSQDFVLFWEHWTIELNAGDNPMGIADRLAEIVSPVLLKTSEPVRIDAGLYDNFEGVQIEGGECMNIIFRQEQPAETGLIPIYGLHGESHAAPPDTEASYWAALGAGAEGIVIGTHLTRDQKLVCSPQNRIDDPEGQSTPICMMDFFTFNQLDAGRTFRSSVLDESNMPSGEYGADTPWDATVDKRRLRHPELEEMLRIFGRRTRIMLLIDDVDHAAQIAGSCIELLLKAGLEKRVTIVSNTQGCKAIRSHCSHTPLAYIADPGVSFITNMAEAKNVSAQYLLISEEKLRSEPKEDIRSTSMGILLVYQKPAPTPDDLEKIYAIKSIKAIIASSVDRSVQSMTPPGLVMEDDFSGTKVNRQRWTCGYSHPNHDTRLEQNDGFIITINPGGEYSGGAVVTKIPIHGPFDAQVDFHVDNPCQATTFEMAAIGIDPGYFNIDDPLNARKLNLTYDVHGAPPYASSERDEDDGFRIGWNNGFNLTRIDSDWHSSSANMYNKYGRDVGYGKKDSPAGSLRLTRNGAVFNAYYKDKFNHAWVCSGSALVPNLGKDVYIRLAAKHWEKGGVPPANKIVFKNFKLFQF